MFLFELAETCLDGGRWARKKAEYRRAHLQWDRLVLYPLYDRCSSMKLATPRAMSTTSSST